MLIIRVLCDKRRIKGPISKFYEMNVWHRSIISLSKEAFFLKMNKPLESEEVILSFRRFGDLEVTPPWCHKGQCYTHHSKPNSCNAPRPPWPSTSEEEGGFHSFSESLNWFCLKCAAVTTASLNNWELGSNLCLDVTADYSSRLLIVAPLPPLQTGRSTKLWPTSVLPSPRLGEGAFWGPRPPNSASFTLIRSDNKNMSLRSWLDNASFERGLTEGCWGEREDALIWKSHTGLIVHLI